MPDTAAGTGCSAMVTVGVFVSFVVVENETVMVSPFFA